MSLPVFIADTCIGGLSVVKSLWHAGRASEAVFLADYAVNPLGVKNDFAIANAVDRWIKSAQEHSGTLIIACNTLSIRYKQLVQSNRPCTRLNHIVTMVDCFAEMVKSEAEKLENRKVLVIGTEFTASQPMYPNILEATLPGIRVDTVAATELERKIARFELQENEGDSLITSGLRRALDKAHVAVLACTCFPMVKPALESMFPDVVFLDPGAYCPALLNQDPAVQHNRLSISVTGHVVTEERVREFAKSYLGNESIDSL